MEYESLKNVESITQYNKEANNAYNIKNDPNFYIFKRKNDFSKQKLNHMVLGAAFDTNWKAHLSIHPEDVAKAWDLVFPEIEKHSLRFKVTNTANVEKQLLSRQQSLEKSHQDLEKFLNKNPENGTNEKRDSLIQFALNTFVVSNDDENRLKLGSYSDAYQFIKMNYEKDITQARQNVEEAQRLHKGTQITLYMQPGQEKEHQQLIEKLAVMLRQEGIRPGQIYRTEKALAGENGFVSIRHPGKTKYQGGTQVENYNPDNVADPFQTFSIRGLKLSDTLQKINTIEPSENTGNSALIEKASTIIKLLQLDTTLNDNDLFSLVDSIEQLVTEPQKNLPNFEKNVAHFANQTGFSFVLVNQLKSLIGLAKQVVGAVLGSKTLKEDGQHELVHAQTQIRKADTLNHSFSAFKKAVQGLNASEAQQAVAATEENPDEAPSPYTPGK